MINGYVIFTVKNDKLCYVSAVENQDNFCQVKYTIKEDEALVFENPDEVRAYWEKCNEIRPCVHHSTMRILSETLWRGW